MIALLLFLILLFLVSKSFINSVLYTIGGLIGLLIVIIFLISKKWRKS